MQQEQVARLIEVLDLEYLDDQLFRGRNLELPPKFVYGGQVVAQALVAASRTVTGALPHSLHAYFLRGGDWSQPILYDVERVRDGKTYSARNVQARQHGHTILQMSASFKSAESGLQHQVSMPELPMPEQLRDISEQGSDWFVNQRHMSAEMRDAAERSWPIQVRPVYPERLRHRGRYPPYDALWFRAAGAIPDDPLLHRAILAYASDADLLTTALNPHGGRVCALHETMLASLDHAIWFHAEPRVDEWLLYSIDSPFAGGARGFARGQIFDRQGRLIASTAQEGVVRALN